MDVPRQRVTGEAASNHPVIFMEMIPLLTKINLSNSLCGFLRARNPRSNLIHKQRLLSQQVRLKQEYPCRK